MTMRGHNNGPTMETGRGWRKHAWTRARADLLPKLPVEVVRIRLARAKELGLDYKTYAGVRAGSGRDVVGFLFSSNALRLLRARLDIPALSAEKLAALQNCARIAVVQPPLEPGVVRAANPGLIEGAAAAPSFAAGWAQTRAAMRGAVALMNTPGDTVLLVGDTAMEREWSMAGRLAGYIPAERYFGKAVADEL